MATSKNAKSWLPHMYMILIGVSIGGALLFSLIFVAVYYYISLRKTFPSRINENEYDAFTRDRKSPSSMPPKGHSSPKSKETKEKSGEEKQKIDQKVMQRTMELSLESNSYSPRQSNLKNSFKNSRESHHRRRSADRRDNERRHAVGATYSEEKIKRSRSKDRVPTNDNIHSKDDTTESHYNRGAGRERRRSTHSDLKRSKSRREKTSRVKEGPEVEINVNDLR